jgi:hypothetical protein
MNSFIKGMGSFNLFPKPRSDKLGPENAWKGVANAFARTGINMRKAIATLDAQATPPVGAMYGK